jgi:hypothetical protein
MKRTFFFLLMAVALFLVIPSVMGQDTGPVHGPGFVDEDGDGVNDKAPDLDRDGIPNGQDSGYERQMHGVSARGSASHEGHGFVDMDGDGLNDWAQDADGDGVPNGQDEDYSRPEDGSGSQHKNSGRSHRGGAEWQSGQNGSMDCMDSENGKCGAGQRGGRGKK